MRRRWRARRWSGLREVNEIVPCEVEELGRVCGWDGACVGQRRVPRRRGSARLGRGSSARAAAAVGRKNATLSLFLSPPAQCGTVLGTGAWRHRNQMVRYILGHALACISGPSNAWVVSPHAPSPAARPSARAAERSGGRERKERGSGRAPAQAHAIGATPSPVPGTQAGGAGVVRCGPNGPPRVPAIRNSHGAGAPKLSHPQASS